MPPEPTSLIGFLGLVIPVSLISLRLFLEQGNSQAPDMVQYTKEKRTVGYVVAMTGLLVAALWIAIVEIVFFPSLPLTKYGFLVAGIGLLVPFFMVVDLWKQYRVEIL